MVYPFTEADIFGRKEEFMVSPTGGIPCKRIAHFLKPTVSSSPIDSKLKQPFLSPKSKWPLDVAFNGWLEPFKKWSEWVDEMHSQHSLIWKRAGILEPILGSKCNFHRVDDLIFGLAERWNCDTNTFVFQWGESTITLEDMMILGGFSVLGAPFFSLVKDENVARICVDLSEVLIKKRMQTHLQWLNYFKNKGKKHEHEAFLSLWLSMFVFPGTEYDKVGEQMIPIAVYLAKGTKIALAPAVLASIYRDMNLLKVSMDASTRMVAEEGEGNILAVSLWAPLYLVQIWAWERFIQFRPDPNPLNKGDPRVARWDDLKRLDIGNVRPIISSSGDVFLWRPYCLSVDNWPFPKFYKQEWTCIRAGECLDKEVESYVVCMRVCVLFGIDCEEPYYPHRVAMQFGFDQDIPASIPRSNSCVDVAWFDDSSSSSRPFRVASKLELPPRLIESDVSTRYLDWWRKDVSVPPLDSFQGLARKKRSCRHARKHSTPNAKKVKNDYYSVLDIQFGCKPKCAEMEDCRQSHVLLSQNGRIKGFDKVKIEAVDMDVPPGFHPKATTLKQVTEKTEAPDLEAPPGFPPIVDKTTRIQDTKLQESIQVKIKNKKPDLEAPPGFPPIVKTTQIQDAKLQESIKVKIKTEAPDLDAPPGFPLIVKITQIQDSKLQETEEEKVQQESNEDARIADNEVIKDVSSSIRSEAIVSSSTTAVGTSCGRMQEIPNAGIGPQKLSDMEAQLRRIERLLLELKNQMTKPVV